MNYKCGEKSGIGTYTCTKCESLKELDDEDDTFPPFSTCNNYEYNIRRFKFNLFS